MFSNEVEKLLKKNTIYKIIFFGGESGCENLAALHWGGLPDQLNDGSRYVGRSLLPLISPVFWNEWSESYLTPELAQSYCA